MFSKDICCICVKMRQHEITVLDLTCLLKARLADSYMASKTRNLFNPFPQIDAF